jgi:hypothetical protein
MELYPSGVLLRITPEPTDAERAAIVAALAELDGEAPATPAWQRASLLEATGVEQAVTDPAVLSFHPRDVRSMRRTSDPVS